MMYSFYLKGLSLKDIDVLGLFSVEVITHTQNAPVKL